jgi:hypothetical protein
MSKCNRERELFRQNNYDLAVQYHELLRLRAELARSFSQSNRSPREHKIMRAFGMDKANASLPARRVDGSFSATSSRARYCE